MCWLGSQTNLQTCLPLFCIIVIQLTLPSGITLCLRKNGFLPALLEFPYSLISLSPAAVSTLEVPCSLELQ